MLKIRLQRVGRKHDPVFRIVLTDSKNGPKSGKFHEILGSYDARDKNVTKFDVEKIKKWISEGVQISDTVHNLLISQKIIEGKKKNVLPKKSPIVDEAKIKAEKEAKDKAEADAKAKLEAEKAEKEAPVVSEDVVAEEVEETAPVAEVKEEVVEEIPTEEVKTEDAPAEETPLSEEKTV